MYSNDEDDLEKAIHEKIEICEYDSEWPIRFALECGRLREISAGKLLSIEHVGSTAVVGLPAKPIIDIIATVDSIDEADRLLPLLCSNGYTTSQEFNAALGDKRWLMRHERGRRTHHLHLVLSTSEEWSNKIRFRDILRHNVDARQEYVALKRRLASELGDDREAYGDAKTEFVKKVLDAG